MCVGGNQVVVKIAQLVKNSRFVIIPLDSHFAMWYNTYFLFCEKRIYVNKIYCGKLWFV